MIPVGLPRLDSQFKGLLHLPMSEENGKKAINNTKNCSKDKVFRSRTTIISHKDYNKKINTTYRNNKYNQST